MIEIDCLSKTYERGAMCALDDVSLAIGSGVFGLLGPNGAGKSTLMRILATLVAPSEGRALVAGHDVRRERAAIRRLLGFLPQEFGFYPRLTAYETLDYLALLSGLGRERRSLREQLRRAPQSRPSGPSYQAAPGEPEFPPPEGQTLPSVLPPYHQSFTGTISQRFEPLVTLFLRSDCP